MPYVRLDITDKKVINKSITEVNPDAVISCAAWATFPEAVSDFQGFIRGFQALTDTTKFRYKCDDFYHANDKGGFTQSNLEIGITWQKIEEAHKGTANAEGYNIDGVSLNIRDKEQNWLDLKDKFKF